MTTKGGSSANAPAQSGAFVSCVAADESESWVVCGGGADGQRGKVTGQLSTWYLPSRSMTSSIQCPAAVQDVKLHEDEIVSVGSEPVIRHWSRHSGELRTLTRSTPPSIFAGETSSILPSFHPSIDAPTATHPHSTAHLPLAILVNINPVEEYQVLVAAGSSPYVDLYLHPYRYTAYCILHTEYYILYTTYCIPHTEYCILYTDDVHPYSNRAFSFQSV
jgi:hypothetical protein